MSGRVHPDDRGLDAVRRVRTAREADSRTGLQLALAESRSLTDRAATAQQQRAADQEGKDAKPEHDEVGEGHRSPAIGR